MKQVGRLRQAASLSSCPDRFPTARTMSVAWQVHTARTPLQGAPADPSCKVELTERAGSEIEEIFAEIGPGTMAGRVQQWRWRCAPRASPPEHPSAARRPYPAPPNRTGVRSYLIPLLSPSPCAKIRPGGRTPAETIRKPVAALVPAVLIMRSAQQDSRLRCPENA